MCGICGIISNEKIPKRLIGKMTNQLIHRGPDGMGHHYEEQCVFGHTRLAIFDLSSAGHQPMLYQNRYLITYNGEIYNFVNLRKRLQNEGYLFKSYTDTEVIMASYDFWGVECLHQFNGMWAFVIYDKLKKTYFISRDRFGKKPLYYYKTANTFIFASEIKAFLVHPLVNTAPNNDFLNNYVQKVCEEFTNQTAFQNIYRFDIASYFEGTIEELLGNFASKQFWVIKPNLSHERYNASKAQIYSKQYYELLEDAVRIRLRADVKVGSALSGGLDSSSIVYIVNKLLREEKKEELQETFSSIYKSDGTQECDESYFIDKVAFKLGVHANKIEPDEKKIPIEYEKMIWHLENPPENSLMSSWHTFKLVASTDVKVTLDGQGADEQLAGYLYYVIHYLSSLTFIELIQEARLYWKVPRAKKYVCVGFLLGCYRIILGERYLKSTLRFLFGEDVQINLNQKLAQDTMSHLITLIHYADHTSMAFGVESRMPFMDYRLVEFLASVPACYKMRNGWTKYLARLAFDGKLPNEVTWRKDKMGWPIPEKKWFYGTLKGWFLEKISECSICKSLVFIKPLKFTSCVKKVNLSLWYKQFFQSRL